MTKLRAQVRAYFKRTLIKDGMSNAEVERLFSANEVILESQIDQVVEIIEDFIGDCFESFACVEDEVEDNDE